MERWRSSSLATSAWIKPQAKRKTEETGKSKPVFFVLGAGTAIYGSFIPKESQSVNGALPGRTAAAHCLAWALAAARWGEVSQACCSGGCFLRFAPRGVLRWCGAAGRCGRFSCFAHAPLIKKSGQKRNQGLLRPAFPSGWSAWGTRASAALRAVSVGGRGKEGIFWLRRKEIWGWILGVGFTLRSEVPCCVAPKGGPVFRDRNGRCGLLQNSHLEGFAARCALRAALRRARGRPRSPNASAPAGAKAFLLGGFSFPSAFEMRKEKPRFRPPYGSFCPIGGCPPRINKSAWLLFRVLFFAGGDTPRKKSTRSAPRTPRQRSKPRGVKR